jgi:hypothetical protein
MLIACVIAAKTMREAPERGFDLVGALATLFAPADVGGALQLAGLVSVGLVAGLFTAAVFAARHGAGGDVAAA